MCFSTVTALYRNTRLTFERAVLSVFSRCIMEGPFLDADRTFQHFICFCITRSRLFFIHHIMMSSKLVNYSKYCMMSSKYEL